MLAGCYEISVSVIVKHVQHVGIISIFCLPGELTKFFSTWGTEKIAGLWLNRGGSVLRLTRWVAKG